MWGLAKYIRDTFISHRDDVPHIFSKASAKILIFIAIIGFSLALIERYSIQKTDILSNVYSSALVDLLNSERGDVALPSLRTNPLLVKAAELKAEDMASKGYFAHYSPDGVSPWYWIKKSGYDYLYAGENLAINFSDSSDVSRAWMNSPTHKANMLNSRYTEVGIAIKSGVYNGRQTDFVVEMFGTPRSMKYAARTEDKFRLVASTGTLFGFMITNPSYMMISVYVAIVIMIVFGLIGIATVEWKKRHFTHLFFSILLLLILTLFAYLYFSSNGTVQVSNIFV